MGNRWRRRGDGGRDECREGEGGEGGKRREGRKARE